MSEKQKSTSVYIVKKSELFHSEQKSSTEIDISSTVFDAAVHRLAMIEASAGTGKTFTLVELVVELLLEQEIPLKRILIVTFTEKATAELRLRLRTKLLDLLKACEQYNSPSKTIPKLPFWEINTIRKKQLKAALLDFDSVPIHTIHGFCKRILSECAFENGQLFEQQLCDTDLLFPEFFRRYIRYELLSKKTSVARLFALYVKYAEGNLGSLEKDILFLLSRDGKFKPDLPAFDDFMVEFSKYWAVLVSRDLNLRKQGLVQHPIRSAFKKTAMNANSARKTLINLDLLIEILAEAHSGESISEILLDFLRIEVDTVTMPRCRKDLKSGEKWLSPKDFPPAELAWIQAVSDCAKLLKNSNFPSGSKKILKAWVTREVLEDVRRYLTKAKLEQGVFDFDDLLRIVEENVIPKKNRSSTVTALTKAVRKKYVCAIVDEFQDTDQRQWNIFRNLFLESPEHRLIVIGDPKQAIYSFRGADIFTYLQAQKTFQLKTSRLAFPLKKNFRSSKEMLLGLNQIFSSAAWFPEKHGIQYYQVGCGNPELKLKDDKTERNAIHLLKMLPQFSISGKKVAEQKKSKNPKITLKMLSELTPLIGNKFYGNKCFLNEVKGLLGEQISQENQTALLNLFLDEQAETATIRFAEEIAREIKSILRIGSTEIKRPVWQDGEGEHTLKGQDICVLFRKNNEGEILAKALRRHGVDFTLYKQKGLFDRREAKEILDLLEAVAHPEDHSRISKLWLTSFFGVKINELPQDSSWDFEFLHQLQIWNSLAEARNFRRLFDLVLESTKLIECELLFSKDERVVTNYVHLFEVLNRKAIEGHLDLFELIRLLRRLIDGKENPGENENLLRLESEREAVQLMTMHAAKGLEFPVVFLFGGFTGNQKKGIQFYHDDAKEPIIDLINSKIPEEYEWQLEAENQRLLYVAMTRAQGRLYLPFVGFLQGNSGKRICKVGRGFSMLNEQLSIINEQIFSEKHNSIFSSSIIGNSAINLKETINEDELGKLRDWEIPELPEIPKSLGGIGSPQRFFSQLRIKKRGFALSSFSRMKRNNEEENTYQERSSSKEYELIEIRKEAELGMRREDDEVEPKIFPEILDSRSDLESQFKGRYFRKDPLPGGTQTGNLLHELLERIDFSLIQESSSVEDWFKLPAVNRMIRSINELYGRSSETDGRIAEIIWNALRTPLRLGVFKGAPELELADVKKELRETDFYFPIPKKLKNKPGIKRSESTHHSDLHPEINAEGWTIEKGFLRGSIDFLFEHETKIFLLDWKSNLLKSYGPESLEHEVIENYELQLQIYSLAVSYWFKLDSEEKYNEKFGGVIYLFLRGVGEQPSNSRDLRNSASQGVYFRRPSWTELKSYETRLSQEKF